MLAETGIPTKKDIIAVAPTDERFSKGPVVIVECFQEIPCDPCIDACRFDAITKPRDINDLPVVDFEKCNGCGICIKECPGLAIFVVDKTYSDTHAIIRIPHEFVPVPEAGQLAIGLDRAGEERGSFEVTKVQKGSFKNKTTILWLKVPHELAMEVRAVKVNCIGV